MINNHNEREVEIEPHKVKNVNPIDKRFSRLDSGKGMSSGLISSQGLSSSKGAGDSSKLYSSDLESSSKEAG
jgi:hypothetical protein